MAVKDLLSTMGKAAVGTPDAIAQGADALDSFLKSAAILNKMAEDQTLRPTREQAGIMQNLLSSRSDEDKRLELEAKMNALNLANRYKFNPDGTLRTQSQMAMQGLNTPNIDDYTAARLLGLGQTDAARQAQAFAGVNNPIGAQISEQYGLMPQGYETAIKGLPPTNQALALLGGGSLPRYMATTETQQRAFDEAQRRQGQAFDYNKELAQIRANQYKDEQEYKRWLKEKEAEGKISEEKYKFRGDRYKYWLDQGTPPIQAMQKANDETVIAYPEQVEQQPQQQTQGGSIVDMAMGQDEPTKSNIPPLNQGGANATQDPQSIYALLANNPRLVEDFIRRNPSISTVKPFAQPPIVPGYGNVDQSILEKLRLKKYGN